MILSVIIGYPDDPPAGSNWIGIFPSNIALSLLIYSDISRSCVSFGSSFIFGLFLINFARLAYLNVLKV